METEPAPQAQRKAWLLVGSAATCSALGSWGCYPEMTLSDLMTGSCGLVLTLVAMLKQQAVGEEKQKQNIISSLFN